MRVIIYILVFFLLSASRLSPAQSPQEDRPPLRGASYADVQLRQELGRVVVAPNGTFFLYEFGRPHLRWTPDANVLGSAAASRQQVLIYMVDVTADEPISEYLFPPNAGATYWLGDLSPDCKTVTLYELDYDDSNLRVGAWDLREGRVRWFGHRPDESQLGRVTAWISNQEFQYLTRGQPAMVRADVRTGLSHACPECSVKALKSAESAVQKERLAAKERAASIDASDIPSGFSLVAGATEADLAIYVKDDRDTLALLFKQPGWSAHILFENNRHVKSLDRHLLR